MRLSLFLLASALLWTPPADAQIRLAGASRLRGVASARGPFLGGALPIVRVSATPAFQDGNGECKHPSISPCGRYVTFETDSNNLGPADTNGQRDIYVRDRDADGDGLFDEAGTAVNTLVSLTPGGAQAGAGSFDPSISEGGGQVAFTSSASNLVVGDTNAVMDIFVRNRDTDGNGVLDEPGGVWTTRVSVSSAGVESNGASSLAKISADGRTVAFESNGSNLHSPDTNGDFDVFFHDRDPDGDGIFDQGNGVTVCVSVDASGQTGDGKSVNAAVSPDGRFVAFDSRAENLVSGDTNGFTDVFVHDRDPDGNGIFDEGNATLVRVSLGVGGAELNGVSNRPHMTPDARHFVFETEATNLGPLDTNNKRDIYVRDRDPDGNGILDEGNAVNHNLSVSSQGVLGNGVSTRARISWSGRYVGYVSLARNLSPEDTNFVFDVFAHDRDPDGDGFFDQGNGVTQLLSKNLANSNGNMLSGNGEISADGRWKTFVSDATNLDPFGDTNGLRDVYVRKLY